MFVKFGYFGLLAITVLNFGLTASSAEAGSSKSSVICSNASGALFTREKCRRNETQLNLADLQASAGTVGPQGPQGPAGIVNINSCHKAYLKHGIPPLLGRATREAYCDANFEFMLSYGTDSFGDANIESMSVQTQKLGNGAEIPVGVAVTVAGPNPQVPNVEAICCLR